MSKKQVERIEMSCAEAILKFVQQNAGRFATVTYRKRTTSYREIRTMNGRIGVRIHATGEGKKFKDSDKGLITMGEMPVNRPRDSKGRFIKGFGTQYRCFNVESVMNIRMNKQEIIVPANY